MANNQKCAQGAEATNDALLLVVNKALGYPKPPVWIGTPPPGVVQSWDGQGPTPIGWTKQPVANYVASALDSALPLPDALVAQLQAGPAQALLSAAEQLTLATAIVARVTVDLDAGGYIPKASAVAQAAMVVEEETKGSPALWRDDEP